VTMTRRAMRLASIGAMSLALGATALSTTTMSAGAQSSNKITVTAGEYFYKLSGSPKPGNVEIVFDNKGIEIHMVEMLQLKPSVTLKQLKQSLLSDDESAIEKLLAGSGNVAGAPELLSEGVATTNITNLKAGRYGMLCFVPAADGTPHIVHGMVKIVDVKGSKSTQKPPADGVVDITLGDSGVTLPSTGVPKSGWIKVTNEASVPRDLILAKYAGANTDFTSVNAEIDQFFGTGKWTSGSAPVVFNGGVGTLPPNGIGYVEVSSLPSGKWVAVSTGGEDDAAPLHTDFTIN